MYTPQYENERKREKARYFLEQMNFEFLIKCRM